MSELSNHQLMVLRSLRRTGWESSLVGILLARCGLDEQGWTQLVEQDLVEEKDGKVRLSRKGLAEYNRQKKGRYF